MTLAFAARLTALLMALAFVQQSLEHLTARPAERALFAPRLILSALLALAILAPGLPLSPPWLTAALVFNNLFILNFFQGPYNGGADRMSLLILLTLCATLWLPTPAWQERAFGYLALQLILSYAISGWVKIVNPAWRSGRALRDVFLFSAYPAGENLRAWSARPRLLLIMSWCVMLFELAFPLAFLTRPTLIAALAIAATFHAANACLFGLNRFFWIWLCAYPSLLWLQSRLLFAGG